MEKLSCKRVLALLALVSVFATVALVPSGYAENGPLVDVLRHRVIQSPDAELIAMQTQQADASLELLRTADLETLDSEGNLVTQNLGFHMGFIGYNIRDLASPLRSPSGTGWLNSSRYSYRLGISYWPLADVEFREGLVRCYDQLSIVPSIYGYIVAPIRSLVPPAQSKYYNSAVESYPYNPGNPFTSSPGEQSTCGILLAANYTFVDVGVIGVVDSYDYWLCPNDSPLPKMVLWDPVIDISPTSYDHGLEFIADLGSVGLAATANNGYRGLIMQGRDFNEYINLCFGTSTQVGGQFDAFYFFYSMGRLPSQLYDFMHSSSDTVEHPGRRNAVGINDPVIDELCETVRYSLDTNAIEAAAKTIQDRLYDTSYDYALAYMTLYSRTYFNAFGQNLNGIVSSPGYGSDNMWTWLNIHWETAPRTEDVDGDGQQETVLVCINWDEPDSFNYNFATTPCEWNVLGQTIDGLTAVNPYNHADVPWLATDWEISKTVDGMDIAFTIRDDVQWQDGTPFTAYDIEWCLEFLRDREVPRYYTAWADLIDVEVINATRLTVRLDAAGLSLFYDISAVGALLAPQIWDRPWESNAAVLDWNPTVAYEVAPGYSPGPNPTPTCVMGTGPFVFQYYDGTGLFDDMWRNENYFMSQAEVADLKTLMFWEAGDEDYNGVVNVLDLTQVSFAYGATPGDINWNSDANFDSNGVIDIRDLGTAAYHLGWQKEYP